MKNTLIILYKRYGIFAILVLMLVISTILSPVFLTSMNLKNILRQISITTMIACGETMLIIAGMIDLAPGSVVALSGTISVSVSLLTGNIFLGILTGVVIGGVTGLISGLIVTKYELPPFIVTLAMMTIARGIIYIYTDGRPIINIGAYANIGKGSLLGIPIPVLFLISLVAITWLILNLTKLGRSIYAIGGNEEAAICSGINVKRVKTIVFVISGLFTGLAGAVLMGRLNSGLPTAGEGYEFDAITAVIIGGTSFTGGLGGVFGTVIGALMIGVLNNTLNLMNVSSFVQQVVKGIIILIAVIIDTKTKAAIKTK